MVKGRGLSIPVLLLIACASLFGRPRKAPVIAPEQAQAHIGQTAQVCGQVARVHLAFKTRGQPTFIDFGQPYPHETFTAVIWGLDRGKFGDPQQRYLNKRVCVTGPITVYRGQPEIILHSPKQVKMKWSPRSIRAEFLPPAHVAIFATNAPRAYAFLARTVPGWTGATEDPRTSKPRDRACSYLLRRS